MLLEVHKVADLEITAEKYSVLSSDCSTNPNVRIDDEFF
jgi:hypothetical protein